MVSILRYVVRTVSGNRIEVSINIALWPSKRCSQAALLQTSRMSRAKAPDSQVRTVNPPAEVMPDTRKVEISYI
jgi:hypothetical protein